VRFDEKRELLVSTEDGVRTVVFRPPGARPVENAVSARHDGRHEPVAATDDGLDDVVAEREAELADVRSQQALAHGYIAPYGVDELLVRHQSLRMLGEVAEDRERLSAQGYLGVVLPETRFGGFEPERRKGKHVLSRLADFDAF
jgi:hypothetical protein